MMVKSIFFVSAFAAVAAAASSSTVSSSASQSASPSPTISLFFAGSEEAGGLGDSIHAYASLIDIKQPLTTAAICIAPRESLCGEYGLQTFTFGGTTTFEYNTQDSFKGATLTGHGDCTIKPETATCRVSFSTSNSVFSTSSVSTTVYTGSAVTFIPATVTAGAEKLSQATATPTGSKPNGGSKVAGMPNLALVGGAAVVGAALAL